MLRPPSAVQITRLYKDLLRYGQQLQYTNKEYFYKRIKREFKKNKALKEETEIIFNYKVSRYLSDKPYYKMMRTLFHSFKSPFSYSIRTKITLDYSKVPNLLETELQEQYVRGSGPGGQAVNKTANCVVLKHTPTGITIKCHETRSLDENRKKARKLLITRLDNLYNKEESIEAQIKREEDKKSANRKKKRDKLNLLKTEWKKREQLE